MSCDCGCCTGARATTPVAEKNRPGLRKIHHRPGTYATFVETMRARLSSTDFSELAPLRMRDAGDASIALCDIWAIAGDVLSFYQDRIANEGYLRTATERNSLLQLGRLTGYEMRPGVSASAYLAYTIDANAAYVNIPAGTRVQSVPATGEKAQTFETAEILSARPDWSQIAVRLNQPQWRQPQKIDRKTGALVTPQSYAGRYDVAKAGLYLQGINTQLKPNDTLLIDYGDELRTPYRVDSVTTDAANQRTQVTLRAWNGQTAGANAAIGARANAAEATQLPMAALVSQLNHFDTPLAVQPRSALTLNRDVTSTLRAGAEAYSRILLTHMPSLQETLIPALRTVNVAAGPPTPIKVYALRTKAAVFGNNAPQKVFTGITANVPDYKNLSLGLAWADLIAEEGAAGIKNLANIPLDAIYDQIKPDGAGTDGSDTGKASFVVFDLPSISGPQPTIFRVLDTGVESMTIGAAITSRVTQLVVGPGWLSTILQNKGSGETAIIQRNASVDVLRQTRIYAQSEELELAPDSLQDPIASDSAEIELDKYYAGLTPGMWVIAGGERSDFTDPDVKVAVAERAMVAAVRHGLTSLVPLDASGQPKSKQAVNLPGDTLHTYVKLAAPLAYSYRRDTFTLYGNVVRATHGETRRETLGAGDATQVFQNFTLKSPPLTYVAAPTPAGVASTLQVRVNNLLWHEVDDVSVAAPNARIYLSRRDDSEATSIVFGDGKHGARLPTGQDNVASIYRSGIGAAGNVRVGQLTLATDKPLGVTGVNNPIRASGGADADTLQQARVNAPLAVTALDRLVSVQDYADFACTFAGIGKATAIKLPGSGGDFVQVTIAGIDDIPIDTTSDLYRNLVDALHDFGDPHLQIRVDIRNALSLVIQASVSLQPDYAWDDVQPQIQAALNCRFGFQARDLGQPVFGSEIIGVIQGVAGVAHVLGGTVRLLSDADLINGLTPLAPAAAANGTASDDSQSAWFTLTPAQGTSDEGSGADGWLSVPAACIDSSGKIQPAQIAYLPPNVPDSLILELAS